VTSFKLGAISIEYVARCAQCHLDAVAKRKNISTRLSKPDHSATLANKLSKLISMLRVVVHMNGNSQVILCGEGEGEKIDFCK
jgi:methyl coenzyme M reductase subunit D